MTTEQTIELAKQAGMEVHPRKRQIRVGADATLGLDSTAVVTRFAELVRNAALDEAKEVCRQVVRETNTTLTWEGCAEIQEALEKEKK